MSNQQLFRIGLLIIILQFASGLNKSKAQNNTWNLAQMASLSASDYEEGYPPQNLINAQSPLCWVVEGGGFQWLEVRFKVPVTLREIRLTIGHEYAGEPIRLMGRTKDNEYFQIEKFENIDLQGDTLLKHNFPQDYEEITLLRLESPGSPLTLCWRDLGLIGYIPGWEPPSDGFELVCQYAPDVIYYNANIITMDEALPEAEAMALKGDRILGVGTREEMFGLAIPACPVSTIDAGGYTILPGFNDNHNHVFTWPQLICSPTGDTSYPDLLTRVQSFAQYGWTSISEMSLGIPQDGSREHLYNAINLDLRGQLPFRLNGYFGSVPDAGTFAIMADSGRMAGKKYTGRLRTPGVKLYIDHPLGSDAGPYSQEEVNDLVATARSHNWQIAAHAVNTEGVEKILTAYELALGAESNDSNRYRIEHAVKVSDDQLNRMKNKGIIASFQLLGPPDWPTQQSHIDHISNTNPEWQMRWREFVDSGVPSVGSTDYPFNNTPCNYSPFRAIYEGVTRKGYIEREHAEWELNQRLTVMQALRLLTLDGAYATFEEFDKGSITPGKWADFVIVSHDPLSLSDPEDLLDIQILQTVVGGITEYCDPSVVPPLCAATESFTIAGMSISASTYLPGNTPDMALDGNEDTYWGSGGGPPQWILIDLLEEYSLAGIELVVDQWPEGHTVHQILARGEGSAGDFTLVHEFAGTTTYGDRLAYEFTEEESGPWRFIKILTTESPSHVSWKEIYIDKILLSSGSDQVINSGKPINIKVLPNPLDRNSILTFQLDHSEYIKARMVSLDGRTELVLCDRYLPPGAHSFSIGGKAIYLSPGVYIVALEYDDGVTMCKVLISEE